MRIFIECFADFQRLFCGFSRISCIHSNFFYVNDITYISNMPFTIFLFFLLYLIYVQDLSLSSANCSGKRRFFDYGGFKEIQETAMRNHAVGVMHVINHFFKSHDES